MVEKPFKLKFIFTKYIKYTVFHTRILVSLPNRQLNYSPITPKNEVLILVTLN